MRKEFQFVIRIVLWLVPPGQHNPVVVFIFVVVASDLLLGGSDGVGLYMGVQKTPAPSHIFEGELGAVRDF